MQKTSPNGLPVMYVGRLTKWGNPFELQDYPRELCIKKYEAYLNAKLKLDPNFLDPLKGKNLVCYCSLNQPCHADIILEILKEAEK